MSKTLLSQEEYSPHHLLFIDEEVWQVVDCRPGQTHEYTLALFATKEKFERMSEDELLSTKETAELIDFHALSFNI